MGGPAMAGTKNGHRRLEDYWIELKNKEKPAREVHHRASNRSQQRSAPGNEKGVSFPALSLMFIPSLEDLRKNCLLFSRD